MFAFSYIAFAFVSSVVASPAPVSKVTVTTWETVSASGNADRVGLKPTGTKPIGTNAASFFAAGWNGTNSTGLNTSAVEAAAVQRNQPVLLPATHWTHNGDDLDMLQPKADHGLYFTPGGGAASSDASHAFVHANITMQKDTVILDHSNYIKLVQCVDNHEGINIVFSNQTAFAAAKSAWANANFTLATYTDDCGNLTNQRSYWDVEKLDFSDDTMTVKATVQEEYDLGAATSQASAAWGTYKSASSSNSSSCGTAPSGTDGIPTGDCGSSSFDAQLDAQLGYVDCDLDGDDACVRDYLTDFGNVPNATSSATTSMITPPPSLSRRELERRGLGDLWSKFTQGVVSVAGDVTSEFGKITSEAASVVNSIATLSKSVDGTINLNVAPPASAMAGGAPWPSSFPLGGVSGSKGVASGSLEAYCVGCYLSGSVELAGQAVWGLTSGLTACNGNVKGDVEAQLAIGVTADGEASNTWEVTLLTATPPGFSVAGLFTVGPFIEVDASATATLTMHGQVEVGAKMSIPDFNVYVDLVDSKKSSKTGLTPQFTKIVNAEADIGLTASLGLPIKIGFGIQIPLLKFDESATLTDTPALEASLSAAVSTDGQGTPSDCKGLDFELKFTNDLAFDALNKFHYDIYQYTSPDLFSSCISVPGLGGNTSSTRASASMSATRAPASGTAVPTGAIGNLISILEHMSHASASGANATKPVSRSGTAFATGSVSGIVQGQPHGTGSASAGYNSVVRGTASGSGAIRSGAHVTGTAAQYLSGTAGHANPSGHVNPSGQANPSGHANPSGYANPSGKSVVYSHASLIKSSGYVSEHSVQASGTGAIHSAHSSPVGSGTGAVHSAHSSPAGTGTGAVHSAHSSPVATGTGAVHSVHSSEKPVGASESLVSHHVSTSRTASASEHVVSSKPVSASEYSSEPVGSHTLSSASHHVSSSKAAQSSEGVSSELRSSSSVHVSSASEGVNSSSHHASSSATALSSESSALHASSSSLHVSSSAAASLSEYAASSSSQHVSSSAAASLSEYAASSSSHHVSSSAIESFSELATSSHHSSSAIVTSSSEIIKSSSSSSSSHSSSSSSSKIIPTTSEAKETPTTAAAPTTQAAAPTTSVAKVAPTTSPEAETPTTTDKGAAAATTTKDGKTAATTKAHARRDDGNSTAPSTMKLVDPTGKFQLDVDADGNLRLVDAGSDAMSSFIDSNNMIITDTNDRYFYYFPDTMNSYGVSRLRAGNKAQIPKTSNMISLYGVKDQAGTEEFKALTLEQKLYNLITCNFQNQPSKIFIADDAVKSLTTLKQDSLRWTVTGDVVTECHAIQWMQPSK